MSTLPARGVARLRSLLPSRAGLAAMGRDPRRDLLAGLTVAIVALPLALGFGVVGALEPLRAAGREYATTPEAISGARGHLQRAGLLPAAPDGTTPVTHRPGPVRTGPGRTGPVTHDTLVDIHPEAK